MELRQESEEVGWRVAGNTGLGGPNTVSAETHGNNNTHSSVNPPERSRDQSALTEVGGEREVEGEKGRGQRTCLLQTTTTTTVINNLYCKININKYKHTCTLFNGSSAFYDRKPIGTHVTTPSAGRQGWGGGGGGVGAKGGRGGGATKHLQTSNTAKLGAWGGEGRGGASSVLQTGSPFWRGRNKADDCATTW